MRKAFAMCDTTKSGFIETSKIASILNTIGQVFDDEDLQELIEQVQLLQMLLTLLRRV
jgi:calmodulin